MKIGIEGNDMTDWIERYYQSKRETLQKEDDALGEKGGPGSGHYGHAGRPGKRGGSLPANVAVSIRTGKTARERQAAAAARGKKPKGPAGTPVSNSLDISMFPGPRSKSGKGLRTALASMDQVHGDGDLAEIPITKTAGTKKFGSYEYSTYSGKPVRIRLSTKSEHPGLGALHEIGHFIDHQGLGTTPGKYGSEQAQYAKLEPDASPAMKKWFDAAKNSQAIQQLKRMYDTNEVKYWPGTKGGEPRIYPADKNWLRYSMRSCEVFARSYCQYIAVRSGNPDLMAELRTSQKSSAGGFGYPDQWQDEDFAPIAAAFDELFEEKGWRR